jgi:hypothetical protein
LLPADRGAVSPRDFMTKTDMFRLLHLKRRGHVRTYPEVDGLVRVMIL